MTAWDKTLATFKANKATGDPYWEAGEMVPVHELEPYREVNRKTHEKFPGHYEGVKSQIQKNGITDMGILFYNPDTHRVYAGEGNTRLAIAKELGFSHVPMRAYRSGHRKAVGGVAPRPWSSDRRVPQDIKPSQIGFTPMKLEESTMNDNDISIVLRESQRFLSEEESFWDKTKSAVSNAVSGAQSFTKALFSPSTAPPAGSAAPGFAPKNNSAPAVVQTKLDTVLGQAAGAASGASKSATAPASTPMHNSIDGMIARIMEGNFDWQELDKLYGSDFKDHKQSSVAVDVHPGAPDVETMLKSHNYHPFNQTKGGTVEYIHPEGHMVDVNPKNLEWNHYSAGSGWTSAGRGISDLNDHVRSFHRAW